MRAIWRGAVGMVLAATWVAGPAAAQEQPQSPAMTCAQATGLVRGRGAVILGIGGYTYDRYVAGQEACSFDEYAEAAFVPTRDDPRCLAGYRCRTRANRAN